MFLGKRDYIAKPLQYTEEQTKIETQIRAHIAFRINTRNYACCQTSACKSLAIELTSFLWQVLFKPAA